MRWNGENPTLEIEYCTIKEIKNVLGHENIGNTMIQNNLERTIFKESNDETTDRATPDI